MSRHTALAGAVLALLAITACTSAPAGGTPEGKPGVPVVAPGRPGEDARTLSPEEAAGLRPAKAPNSADVAYARNMVAHHRQALTMTALADKYARSGPVRAMAARIEDTQGPEIEAMRGWLKRNGKAGKPGGGHDHASMPGMATKGQLGRLGKARGKDFDELFLDLMTVHHEGAVSMATDVLAQGNDVLVEEMANDVIATQTSEINRMRDL